jgi:hypothetical protein
MSLRIVIPISRSDVHLLDGFVDVLLHHKTVDNHYMTLVPTSSVGEQALAAAARIRPFCPNVTVEQMPIDPEGGWPIAPNHQFAWTCYMLQRIGNTMPWFWMELDCTPMRKFWADELASDYAVKKMPYMGHVRKVPERDKNGNAVDGKENMMIGCAIYPANILDRSCLIADFLKQPPPKDIGFDIYLSQEQMNPSYGGMAHTDLIQDAWNTHQYQDIDGFLMGKAAPSQFVARARGGPVDPKACIVHGCKDGSLARLVVGGRTFEAALTLQKGLDSLQKEAQSILRDQEAEAQMLPKSDSPSMFDQFKAYMEREFLPLMLSKMQPSEEESARRKETFEKLRKLYPPPEEPDVVSLPDNGPLPKAIALLKEKNIRLDQLVEAVGMKEKLLLPMLEAAGYTTNGPAKWVKLKELPNQS